MANKKFSELTALPSFSDASIMCIVKDNTSYKATIGNLADYWGIDVFELPKGYDSIVFEWKNVSTVTVLFSGSCKSDDGTKDYNIPSNEDISFALNLAYGESENASTLYYLWIGLNSESLQEIVISENDSTVPNESGEATQLTKAHRLRGCIYNNASSDIVLFLMQDGLYQYQVTAQCAGADAFEVYDAAMSTTFVDVPCGSFVPLGTQWVKVSIHTVGAGKHSYRRNGDTHDGILAITIYDEYIAPVDSDLIYEAKNSGGQTTRIALTGFLF